MVIPKPCLILRFPVSVALPWNSSPSTYTGRQLFTPARSYTKAFLTLVAVKDILPFASTDIVGLSPAASTITPPIVVEVAGARAPCVALEPS